MRLKKIHLILCCDGMLLLISSHVSSASEDADQDKNAWISQPAVLHYDQRDAELVCHYPDKHYGCFWFSPWGAHCSEQEICDQTVTVVQNTTSCTIAITDANRERHVGDWTCRLITSVGLDSMDSVDVSTTVFFVNNTLPQLSGPNFPLEFLSDDGVQNVSFECLLSDPSPLTEFLWTIGEQVVATNIVKSEVDSGKIPEVVSNSITVALERKHYGDNVACRTTKLHSDGIAVFDPTSSSYALDVMAMSPIVKQERFENVSMLVLEVESAPSPRRVEIYMYDSNQGGLEDIIALYECPPLIGQEEIICIAQEETPTFLSSASVRTSSSLTSKSSSLFQVRLECHSLSVDGVKIMVLLDNGVGSAVYSSTIYIAPESQWDQEALQHQGGDSSVSATATAVYVLIAVAVVILALGLFIHFGRKKHWFKRGEYQVPREDGFTETEV